jgi:hypothetical protein
MFDLQWKESFVEREHRTRWNADGTPVLNTVDEGLNYGTEYDNVQVSQYTPYDGYKWLVIVAKNPMHQGMIANTVTPTVLGTPTPLSVYLVPFKDNNTVPNVVDTTGNGVVLSKPTDVLTNLYSDTTAVNNIVSIYITDYTGIPLTYDTDLFTFSAAGGNAILPAQIKDGSGSNFFNCLYVKTVNQFIPATHDMGDKYDGYHTVTESKLLMHPYTQLVLMDFKGNHATFKNEYIQNVNLTLLSKGGLGVSNKNSYGIKNYNYVVDSNGDAMSDETALMNNEANDIPIITDLLSAYIQGNKNTLQNQKDSIFFHSYMGILGGFASGNPAAAVYGSVEGVGNTMLQIQGINAKLKDISNVPPNIAKMGSNTSYTLGNGYDGVYVIKKQIKSEYIKKLTDFFKLFGYKVNELKLPNLHTRQSFNFIKTIGANITGNVPNENLSTLKDIFDKGITLWHTDDVLNYSLANDELL